MDVWFDSGSGGCVGAARKNCATQRIYIWKNQISIGAEFPVEFAYKRNKQLLPTNSSIAALLDRQAAR